MSLFKKVAEANAARAEMTLARLEVAVPARALLARGQRYPLTSVGAAAGAGFLLGTFNIHPLRVPGVSSLVGGGLAEIVLQGSQLISELGAFGMGPSKRERAPAADQDPTPAPDVDLA